MSCSGTTDNFQFVSMSFIAGADTEVVTTGTVQEDATDPQVTLSVGGRNSIGVVAIYSGQDAVSSLTIVASMSAVQDYDDGTWVTRVDRQTNPSTSNFTIGYTSTVEDTALSALSLSQIVAGGNKAGGLVNTPILKGLTGGGLVP